MLTGLLFAIEGALDEPARLVATLPFAGVTLIEHQARLLIAAGAAHLIVICDRPSPELAGALHRIGRQGIAVDALPGAVEAAAMLHPLACVVMLADGLVTTDAVIRTVSMGTADALLVMTAEDAPPGFERVGGGCAWTGVARLSPERLNDLARLPPDYDPQSTLVRLAEAAGAARVSLPTTALHDGHGIERDAAALDRRGRSIVAAATAAPSGWFARYLAAPLARAAVPRLLGRGIETAMVAAAAAVFAIGGSVAIVAGSPRAGMVLALVAILTSSLADTMATVRDERRWRGGLVMAVRAGTAMTALLLGWRASAVTGSGTALTIAIALIATVALVIRTGTPRPFWWADPASCVAVVALTTLVGWPVAGLGLAACYAAATLAMAVESLRGDA